METLSERFSALQETLMDLYESGREDLQSQIDHWQALRQEQILLHFARKHGVMRLGYQPVPPLATSESKAKDAIGMVILLQSLQRSKYGQEPWTLLQTSLEAVRSPPANCFKKGPQNIEVIFDGDPENLMSYTVWKYIYYQTLNDSWEKVEGQVDYFGAFYYEGTLKTYYIDFETEAARYGTTGKWEVHVNKNVVFAPVTSSSPPAGDGAGGEASSNTTSRSESPSVVTASTLSSQQRPLTTTSRRYRRKASSPTAARQKRQRQKAITRRSRSRSRGRTETTRGGRGGRASSADSDSSTTGRGRGSGRRPTTRSQSRSQSRSRSRSQSRSGRVASSSGISPAEVGTGVRSVGKGHHGRLARLLDEAKDPPVIILRGDANVLKCYRYRARKKHQGLVKYYSTTWSWVGGDCCDRVGRSRLLLAFDTNKQREQFISTMKLPPKVDWSFGNLDEL